jgi:hypothetical protein
MSLGSILLRALAWGTVGLFAVPFAVFVAMIVVYQLDPRCGTAGDSGGCEMGIFVAVLASALPGAIIFFIFVLIRGIGRRGQPGPERAAPDPPR